MLNFTIPADGLIIGPASSGRIHKAGNRGNRSHVRVELTRDRRLIEEEIVVTPTGHEVITRFPADQLLVAGAHYVTVDGPLPTTRETEAAPSRRVIEMIEASTKGERVEVGK